MKSILVVKNVSREGAGIFESVFSERGVPLQVTDLEKDDPFPRPAPEDFGAVLVMGGPDSANDGTRKMKTELARIRECLNAGIPYLGICLGLQTLVKAAGGEVIPSPVREIGFRGPDGRPFEVELTPEGTADPLFRGMEPGFKVFQLHGETVKLGRGMTLLGEGKFCRNQAVRVGANAYGLQYHLELTPDMFETWLKGDHDLRRMDAAVLRREFDSFRSEYEKACRGLAENFLRIAGYPAMHPEDKPARRCS